MMKIAAAASESGTVYFLSVSVEVIVICDTCVVMSDVCTCRPAGTRQM